MTPRSEKFIGDLFEEAAEAEEYYRKNPEIFREPRELLGDLVSESGIEFAVGFLTGAAHVLAALEDENEEKKRLMDKARGMFVVTKGGRG
jgi:hypothetical protein